MDVGGARDIGLGHHHTVGVGDVEIGVDDHDGPLRRNPVDIGQNHASAAEIDRVETPGEQRGALGQSLLVRLQCRHHLVDALQAGRRLAVRARAVEVADIGELPNAALEGVAVALDKAGQDNLVGEARVELDLAPAPEFLERARTEDAAVAHRHVRGEGTVGIHRDDAAGRIDGDAHAAFPDFFRAWWVNASPMQ